MMMPIRYSYVVLYYILLLLPSLFFMTPWVSVIAANVKENDSLSPEELYKETVTQWKSKNNNNWFVWKDYGQSVYEMFQNTTEDEEESKLKWIGSIEEGILTIERTVFQNNENMESKYYSATDSVRDTTLSFLYTKYAQILSNLSFELCTKLALDPHTLLMGITDTTKDSSSQQHLCIENAENSLRNAITLDATNTLATKLLGELLLGTDDENIDIVVHQRKPKEFVSELFDSFADTFDDKLLNDLQYRVPQMIGDLSMKLLMEDENDDLHFYTAVLDAGCGTGLVGRYLKPLLKPNTGILIGVDASIKMLSKAQECTITNGCGLEISTTNDVGSSPPLYDALLQLDLDEMTIDNTLHHDDNHNHAAAKIHSFDLIVAADVLVYFGSLEHVLKTFAKLSSDRTSTNISHLIFSCELTTMDEAPLGWRLLPSGRFAHTKEHVIEMAIKAGYEKELVHYEEIIPRMEKGEPVRGHLFAFELIGEGGGGSLPNSSSNNNNNNNKEEQEL